MFFQILFVPILLLLLPGTLIYQLWERAESGVYPWLISAISTAFFLGYLYLVAPWSWLNYYLRVPWLVVFIAVFLISYRKLKNSNPPSHGMRTWGDLFICLLFLGFFIFSVRGYFYSDQPVHLEFPLKEGSYYIGQGGNSPLVNYHNTHATQKYALDILALNRAGARAAGVYPKDLNRYEIFGHAVYSPCQGTVFDAVDGLPDQSPPESDRSQPAGNHIILQCNEVKVLLAHLQKDSIAVKKGSTVNVGQPLAKVGNSGNTSEPHLHMHAVRSQETETQADQPVPMLFNGRFPVRNMVIRP